MPGTVAGGRKAAKTNRLRYNTADQDFYEMIGAAGGKKSRGGGLTGDPGRAAEIGSKGGSLSKVGYTLISNKLDKRIYQNKVNGSKMVYVLQDGQWVKK